MSQGGFLAAALKMVGKREEPPFKTEAQSDRCSES